MSHKNIAGYGECILSWVSQILGSEVSMADLRDGCAIFDLINLTDDVHIGGTFNNPESLVKLFTYLDGCFRFRISDIIPPKLLLEMNEEPYVLGVCLAVLIACLHSRAKKIFMDAALDLDRDTQVQIFGLLREPMSKVSCDEPLTHALLVDVFSTTTQQDIRRTDDMANTPIKAVTYCDGNRKSWCAPVNGTSCTSEPLCRSWTAGTGASNCKVETNVRTPDAAVFRVPLSVGHHTSKQLERMTPDLSDRTQSSGDQHAPGPHLGNLLIKTDYSCPVSPRLPSFAHSSCRELRSLRSAQSNDIHLQPSTLTSGFNDIQSFHSSTATSFADLTDFHRSNQLPLASPLASLKNFLDSPLWTQKTRLRETERECRRLASELDKERSYRDEMECLVSELRRQLDESRIRSTEAEAKASRLTRDLAAMQDQADELTVCRTELALREDEVESLKQRMNSLQDLLGRVRKLETENHTLRQECADHRQKVDQLTAKLGEVKDRQLIYTEVETLRSKLRDAEAQLAQLMEDSEKNEKDARRQQELYNQLKLQQSLALARQTSANRGLVTETAVNGKPISDHSINDIEFECGLVQSEIHSAPLPIGDSFVVPSGENLGSVLESELEAANAKIAKLQSELSDATNQLAQRDAEVRELVERVSELNSDVTSLTVQREFSEETSKQAQESLANLQDDLAILEGRILLFHPSRQSDSTSDSTSFSPLRDPFEQFRPLGLGIADPLDRIYALLLDRIHEVWKTHVTYVSSIQLSLSDTRSQLQQLNNLLSSKETALETVQSALNRQLESSTSMQTTLRSTITDLEQTNEMLQKKLDHQLQTSVTLKERVSALETELHKLTNASADSKETGVQTDESLSQFPVLVDAESLERLDEVVDEPPRNDVELSPTAVRDTSESALQSLTADRRGLSNELVRLHDELTESYAQAEELVDQNAQLLNKLALAESTLQQQTTLLTHAQQNWALLERKDRENDQRIRQMQHAHASEIESLHNKLRSQIEMAEKLEAMHVQHTSEKHDLELQLSDAQNEIARVYAERAHLSQRNEDLHRELITTQTLINTILRGDVTAFNDQRPFFEDLKQGNLGAPVEERVNGALDDWISNVQRPDANQDCSSSSSGLCCSSHVTSPRHAPQPRCANSLRDQRFCVSECQNVMSRETTTKRDRPNSIVDELARLSSRTAMLESFALELSERKNQIENSRQPSAMAHTSTIKENSKRRSRGAKRPSVAYSANGHVATRDPLDTDADSSAYTDLSQVSVASRNSPHARLSTRSAAAHSSPIPGSRRPPTQVRQQSDPLHGNATRKFSPCVSRPLNSGPTDKNSTFSGHDACECPEDAKLTDPDRIPELHRRNRLQPLHLRTSYPVETQTVVPENLTDALRRLVTVDSKSRNAVPVHPASLNSKDHGNVLKEVDEENLTDSVLFTNTVKNRGAREKDSSNADTKMSSPIPAGYQRIPRHLQELTDALIAASYDSSVVVDALSAELQRVSASSNSSHTDSRVNSSKPTTQSNMTQYQGMSECAGRSSKSGAFMDENVNPPLPVHDRCEFRKPAPPSMRNGRRNCSGDSLESQSEASSVASFPSSVAFEIPVERTSHKAGALPAPRLPRTATTRRVKSSDHHKSTQRRSVPPNMINEASAGTPLQRNSKCLDRV